MQRGPTWYKRNPVDFLGGVHALSAKEIAVYTICLELIYVHGDNVDNSPKMIAGYIGDLGTAAVRNIINALIQKGKLHLTKDGKLTNARAKAELSACGKGEG